MNRSISSRHRASWTTSTVTPRLRSRASSPMKVWFSPTITRGMP